MTAAEQWVRERLPEAPPRLIEAMVAALPGDTQLGVPSALARGALTLYGSLAHGGSERCDALPLLAADALMTHAFHAQAELEPAGVAELARTWGPRGALGNLAAESLPLPLSAAPMAFDLIDALRHCRDAEREQALYYRTLAALAEDGGDDVLSERFNELHADEQHHVSRLTARLLELGAAAPEPPRSDIAWIRLDGWEEIARERELEEVRRYEALLENAMDSTTAALTREIVATERHHADELGGKWTPA